MNTTFNIPSIPMVMDNTINNIMETITKKIGNKDSDFNERFKFEKETFSGDDPLIIINTTNQEDFNNLIETIKFFNYTIVLQEKYKVVLRVND